MGPSPSRLRPRQPPAASPPQKSPAAVAAASPEDWFQLEVCFPVRAGGGRSAGWGWTGARAGLIFQINPTAIRRAQIFQQLLGRNLRSILAQSNIAYERIFYICFGKTQLPHLSNILRFV